MEYFLLILILFANLSIHEQKINNYLLNPIINKKQYSQVPQNELIFAKKQAVEPMYFYKGKLKGLGWVEALEKEIILDLRRSKFDVYVDYFTPAKTGFYLSKKQYILCTLTNTEINRYRRSLRPSNDSYILKSIPFLFFTNTPKFAILKNKIPYIEKYKYPGTQIYNIKNILDDENLKTIQVEKMTSSIFRYIYEDLYFQDRNSFTKEAFLKKNYKKRIYQFVASDAFQIPLMLQGERMDWVDLLIWSDFYFKKLDISSSKISILNYSIENPKLPYEDTSFKIATIVCKGKSKIDIHNIIDRVNNIIKKYRTNLVFWTKVLKDFARDTETSYESPMEFERLMINFKLKKEIDAGKFDK